MARHGMMPDISMLSMKGNASRGVLDRPAIVFIDDLENAFEGNACRLFLRPAGQRPRGRIEKRDAAFDVGSNPSPILERVTRSHSRCSCSASAVSFDSGVSLSLSIVIPLFPGVK